MTVVWLGEGTLEVTGKTTDDVGGMGTPQPLLCQGIPDGAEGIAVGV
jgi:hypothetical protein